MKGKFGKKDERNNLIASKNDIRIKLNTQLLIQHPDEPFVHTHSFHSTPRNAYWRMVEIIIDR